MPECRKKRTCLDQQHHGAPSPATQKPLRPLCLSPFSINVPSLHLLCVTSLTCERPPLGAAHKIERGRWRSNSVIHRQTLATGAACNGSTQVSNDSCRQRQRRNLPAECKLICLQHQELPLYPQQTKRMRLFASFILAWPTIAAAHFRPNVPERLIRSSRASAYTPHQIASAAPPLSPKETVSLIFFSSDPSARQVAYSPTRRVLARSILWQELAPVSGRGTTRKHSVMHYLSTSGMVPRRD
ncbi:hypothetical protein QBC34DRAFT_167337 [Podospora aff. communis PSN243]|uniref:Uncharacterized protein n=1 Tax=Podospora aff. communis PSN243 TaxID=3040156 RepID=A0AAV9G915_9PEZI|nr:hypothetical protein QBC34DRAFT_167337 [Podospora aff. communis PSN243]